MIFLLLFFLSRRELCSMIFLQYTTPFLEFSALSVMIPVFAIVVAYRNVI